MVRVWAFGAVPSATVELSVRLVEAPQAVLPIDDHLAAMTGSHRHWATFGGVQSRPGHLLERAERALADGLTLEDGGGGWCWD